MKNRFQVFEMLVQSVCADIRGWISGAWRKAFAVIVGTFVAFALIGCANSLTAYPYHGLQISNQGSARVEQIEVRYGELVRKLPALQPMIGNGYTQDMPIPETMSVKWKSSTGASHSVEVPVKSKLARRGELRGVEVLIKDENLEVNEIWHEGPATDPKLNINKIYP